MTNKAKPTAGEAEALSPEGKELLSIICRDNVTRSRPGPRKIRTVSTTSPAPAGYVWKAVRNVHVGQTVAFLNHAGQHDPVQDQQVVRIRTDKEDASLRLLTFPERVESTPTGERVVVEKKTTIKRNEHDLILVKEV